MTLPAAPPTLATDPGARVTLPATVQAAGFKEGPGADATLPGKQLNHGLGSSLDWAGVVADFMVATDVSKWGKIVGIGDPGDAGTDLTITTTSGDLKIAPAADTNVSATATGTGQAAIFSTAGGLLTTPTAFGIVALGDATLTNSIGLAVTSGIWTYTGAGHVFSGPVVRTEIAMPINVSPYLGGYTLANVNASAAYDVALYGAANITAKTLSGADHTAGWRRPLFEIKSDPAAAAASQTNYVLGDLTSTWAAATDLGTSLRVIKRVKSTGVETTLRTVSPSSTSDTSAAVTLDPVLDAYYVELFVDFTVATSTLSRGVGECELDVKKYVLH